VQAGGSERGECGGGDECGPEGASEVSAVVVVVVRAGWSDRSECRGDSECGTSAVVVVVSAG
jgi:hypothetical protein